MTLIDGPKVPIYIAEMAPPAIRGRLVGTYELGWQIGGLVGFWINYGMINTLPGSRNQWLIPFAIQLVPAGMLLIGSLMLKETPRWLFTKGRYDEGIKNLCWIRKLEADHTYILEEIAMMEQQIQDLPRGFFSPIKDALEDSKTRWRLFLGHSLFILQNFAGVNAIVSRHFRLAFANLNHILTHLRTTIPLTSSDQSASEARILSTSLPAFSAWSKRSSLSSGSQFSLTNGVVANY